MMHARFRVIPISIIGISILMAAFLGTQLGGEGPLAIRNFCPLAGALIGSILTLVCANLPIRQGENAEPWLRNERLAWNLIGLGLVVWAIGETIWRYYRVLDQTPFPSWADAGYASYPPLVFAGLLLLPSSQNYEKRRFLVLDSLISVGSLLSMAWLVLLGSLAQTPSETLLGKALGLYYPITDTLLLSLTIFLLLRGSGQTEGRRIGLLIAGFGLFVLAAADFNFNVQQNLGIYVEGNWTDLGWPVGIMAIGVAAYVRRFWSASMLEREQRLSVRQVQFGPTQAVPYMLLLTLFILLVYNVLSQDQTQQNIRPVLVAATMIVVVLVLVRQVLTMQENALLLQKQKAVLQERERINQNVAERNALLETGIAHLKDIQTRLANGDVRARAYITNGELWPLANGLNLMADRMMRSDRTQKDSQHITRAISDFCQALERMQGGNPLTLPVSCLHIPEMRRLFTALGLMKTELEAGTPPLFYPQPASGPLNTPPNTPFSTFPHQPSPPPTLRWKISLDQEHEPG